MAIAEILDFDSLLEFCERSAPHWWGGDALPVPDEAWPILQQVVQSPDLALKAISKLSGDAQALGMFQAFSRQIATADPLDGKILAGFPILVKGKLVDMPGRLALPPKLHDSLSNKLTCGTAVLHSIPWLLDAREITRLSLSDLHQLAVRVFDDPGAVELPPVKAWSDWEERMLVWLFVLEGPAALPDLAAIAAAEVTEWLRPQMTGAPLYLQVRPPQPIARLFTAYALFRIQKLLAHIAGPWEVELRKVRQEGQLTWPGGTAVLDVQEVPWPWVVQAVTAKVHSAGGKLALA